MCIRDRAIAHAKAVSKEKKKCHYVIRDDRDNKVFVDENDLVRLFEKLIATFNEKGERVKK